MKKIILLFAVVALAFVSCTKDVIKEDIPSIENIPSEIKINISVAAPGMEATKAVKTGWENGDKINIWFDGRITETPDLIIDYNGTNWVAGELNVDAKNGLKTDNTGTMYYVYEGGNDLDYYTVQKFDPYMFSSPSGNSPVEYFAPKLMLSSHGDGSGSYSDMPYKYDGEELTLNLNRWGYITNLQVVITGLTGKSEDWYLTGYDGSPSYKWYSIQDFRLYGNCGESTKYSRGTANADGVAFYFKEENDGFYNVASTDSKAEHVLTLTNGINTYTFTKKNAPFTSTYKTEHPDAKYWEILDNTFTAIKVDFSKFEKVVPEGALPGKFTINSDGDQVYFSKGNLYWDSKSFKFEANQTDWSKSTFTDGNYHVSHFFWSKNKDIASDSIYDDDQLSIDDVLFTNDDGFEVNGQKHIWRALSSDEWQFIIGVEGTQGVDFRNVEKRFAEATVNGTKGLLIFPDDFVWNAFMGNEPEYNVPADFSDNPCDVNEFAAMQNAGVVFLPSAGNYDRNQESDLNNPDYGWYWSSSPMPQVKDLDGPQYYARNFFFGNEIVPCGCDYRTFALCIRLVTDCK